MGEGGRRRGGKGAWGAREPAGGQSPATGTVEEGLGTEGGAPPPNRGL